MKINDEQKKYIKENYKKLSVRQLAKSLNVSRPDIEKYLQTLTSVSLAGVLEENRLVPRIRKRWLVLFLFSLTLLTFSNSIHYDFVYDDTVLLMDSSVNGIIGPPTPRAYLKDLSISSLMKFFTSPLFVGNKGTLHYRPMQNLCNVFNYTLCGLNPISFHMVNILLQCAGAIILFLLLCRILKNKEVAFWAAAFFSVHPVQIAAVTYIAGRAEMLGLIFMLMSLWFYDKSFENSLSIKKEFAGVLSVFFFFCGILSKEMIFIAPILFIAYGLIFKKNKTLFSITHIVCYVVAVSSYVALRLAALNRIGGAEVIKKIPWSSRPWFALKAIACYTRLIFLPNDLHMGYRYTYPPTIYEPAVIAGLLISISFFAWMYFSKKSNAALFGWFWFWIFLIPVLNIFFLLNAPLAEHWLYIPLIGFFIVLVNQWLSFDLFRKNFSRLKEIGLIVLLLSYAFTTWHSNYVWKDEISLYSNVLKYTPWLPEMHTNLAKAYLKKNMTEEAKQEFQKAQENSQFGIST